MNREKKTATQKQEVDDPILTELYSIKRLITLFLLKAGATQDEVAMALDIDQSNVSRLFPNKIKKFELMKD